ncbi:MAG: fatty-acid oxidation protein subunit alpha [Planctomycetes bacterium]|nr:fatty-acid oxidation protein subunit alpha [Planctomycetota bacterium]
MKSWTLHIDSDWIAWLTFDLPGSSVNKFTEASMTELAEQLDELADDEAIKAVAIRSGKSDTFIVGADIDELAAIGTSTDALAKAKRGHEVFARLAALPVPTVAVIHGTALGGGLEMALACDYRLVTDDPGTSVGLPEVNLGIIPGWGGTQRLPHVVGLSAALPMILAGKQANARKAYRIGLADGVVPRAFLEQRTREFVDRILKSSGRRAVVHRRHAVRPRVARMLERWGPGRRLICHLARRQVMSKTRGQYPAPLEALSVLRRTYRPTTPPDGFDLEARAFSRLACSAISRNLVWLFQASQRLKRAGRGDRGAVSLEAGDHAAVIGAGIMGGGIAWALSRGGLHVRMKDLDWGAVASGMAAASRMYGAMVKRRKITAREQGLAMHRISGAIDYSGLSQAKVVVEAVVEDLDIKKRVLREIEEHVSPDTIICTNTSSLPLNELASGLKHPKRFAGLHFFNPVNRMQLIEVVGARKTSRRTVVSLVDLCRLMGKTPVVVGDCPGFLVNRILLPYLIESAWMFEEGAAIERIDAALERFGMPMGPLALVDEVGIDVGYKVAKVLESAYGERMHVADVLGKVVQSTELTGRKSGRGFYLYGRKDRKPNARLTELTADARRHDGLSETDLGDEEIVDRAVLIMVNEAARCLDEGIVDDPEKLDLAMVLGTGFAPFRGGLLRYADERGLEPIRQRLEELALMYGDRFRPVPLIEKIARDGGRFHDTGESSG